MDNNGIRLIHKGKKGLLRIVFSRVALLIVLMGIQLCLHFAIMIWAATFLPHYVLIMQVFSVVMVLVLLNSNIDASAKLTWLLIILLVPLFGALFFWYVQSDIGHRLLAKRTRTLVEATKTSLAQDETVLAELAQTRPEACGLVRYMSNSNCHPVFRDGGVQYFPLGDDMFPEILRELEKAEKFIFLEFFIIDEGLMWGRILERLIAKVKQGVEVRLLYDGTLELTTLPHDYPKRLAQFGIKCRVFSPAQPFVSTHYNYRDHRKILVVDGRVAFNGGVNLADEYINHIKRFGHWKDTAVKVTGPAVDSYTLMFLQMWNIMDREPVFAPYIYASKNYPVEQFSKGFVIPYGDSPLDGDKVGEKVYMDLLNRARKSIHIMSPYLILDGELETAICFAAERGVDVKLILPGIPDKKMPYALARMHFKSLISSGVHIYEYTPGFVHAKNFLMDGEEGVVGTINLDYRSLYHHFECATYLCGVPVLADIEKDFAETLLKCREVRIAEIWKGHRFLQLFGFLLRALAPLM